MTTMKRNFTMLMLMVAAILFCSQQQVVVGREVVDVADDNNGLQPYPWEWPCYLPWPFPFPRPWPCPGPPPPPPPPPSPPPPPPPCPPPPPPKSSCSAGDKEKVKKCMFNTTSLDACCPTFKSILGTSCSCYKYAEDLDNLVLITLEAYCDVTSPCTPPPKSSCAAGDKEKVKKCMFNTTSIDACCPTFKSILGTSCSCYKYAEDLDNQVLITLEAYCDVTSPCKGVQVIKLSKEE